MLINLFGPGVVDGHRQAQGRAHQAPERRAVGNHGPADRPQLLGSLQGLQQRSAAGGRVMEIKRVTADAAALLDPADAVWQQAAAQDFPMVPTPLKNNPAIEAISPFIAQSTDHGVIHGLTVAGSAQRQGAGAAPVLGQRPARQDCRPGPVRGRRGGDVPAHGQGQRRHHGQPRRAGQRLVLEGRQGRTALRRGGRGLRHLRAPLRQGRQARSRGPSTRTATGTWCWQRPLDIGNTHAQFQPGTPTKLAFGVWNGGNRERAGRKSFSGDFQLVTVAA